jgi:nickel/cobalt transporter (NicO) family protein
VREAGSYLLIFTDAKVRIYGRRVSTLPVLLLAAAGIGLGHAVMPDHWLPLAVLSRARRYHTARVLRLSLAAALTHVAVSLLFGGVLVVIGLQFRATVTRHTDLFVGGTLLATGAVMLLLDLRGKGHGHAHDRQGNHGGHDGHPDDHDHAGPGLGHHHGQDGHSHRHTPTAVLERPEVAPAKRVDRGLARLLIPFGAAASPDLTILPVFLAASALGATAALGCLAAFALTTVGTIVGLATATALGASLFTAPWIDRSADLITALTLIAIGVLVASGVI